jgi:hypothetical protein
MKTGKYRILVTTTEWKFRLFIVLNQNQFLAVGSVKGE